VEGNKTVKAFGVKGSLDGNRPLIKYNFWATRKAVCPEPFIAINFKFGPRARVDYTIHVIHDDQQQIAYLASVGYLQVLRSAPRMGLEPTTIWLTACTASRNRFWLRLDLSIAGRP